MEFTGIHVNDVRDIVELVSRECYQGNLIVKDSTDLRGKRRPRGRLTLVVKTGIGEGKRSAPGARRTEPSGRMVNGKRMPFACWHTYRDVLSVVFDRHPDAVVRTSFAKYDGIDGFVETYPGTDRAGGWQWGASVRAVPLSSLCECDHPIYCPPPSWVIQEEPDFVSAAA